MGAPPIQITARFVAGHILTWVLVTRSVVAARQATGLSQREFAVACGWSRDIQRRLEDGDGTASTQELRTLARVLREHGVLIEDLPAEPRPTLREGINPPV